MTCKKYRWCSGTWLKHLEDFVFRHHDRFPKLVQCATTRWSSSHSCLASLLRVKRALQMTQAFGGDKFPDERKVDVTFMFKCTELEKCLRPLVYFSLLVQKIEVSISCVLCTRLTVLKPAVTHLSFAGAKQNSVYICCLRFLSHAARRLGETWLIF